MAPFYIVEWSHSVSQNLCCLLDGRGRGRVHGVLLSSLRLSALLRQGALELKQHTVNLHVIPSTAMNLLVVLGVRFLAPLELTDTMLQSMLPWL
jgi:hypothetical protein